MECIKAGDAASTLPALLHRAIAFNEPIGIESSEGKAVLISEEEYGALMETVFIMRNEKARRDILEAAAEDLAECIEEEDAQW